MFSDFNGFLLSKEKYPQEINNKYAEFIGISRLQSVSDFMCHNLNGTHTLFPLLILSWSFMPGPLLSEDILRRKYKVPLLGVHGLQKANL
jgi:hypothetical protein